MRVYSCTGPYFIVTDYEEGKPVNQMKWNKDELRDFMDKAYWEHRYMHDPEQTMET
ncbi:hypothetical protein FF098_014910 [Parvularcula flava]|uniref:Uncharacterized protein n=1 Tax=Aquisalinus luteolus TaxID=1566827 RepID=A0A8J3A9C2_9PROT|nr:hypothetical protein [Aquisalinus luteolus]NHK29209.1 hypothetical protein [Aquisalinus luteolus]GGH99963.1 hypothetical protein GCM10011355_27140 [Aquisalinus luteolus]